MHHPHFFKLFPALLALCFLFPARTLCAEGESAPAYLQKDLAEILALAKWPGPALALKKNGKAAPGSFSIRCPQGRIEITAGDDPGYTSALRELGLFLPHPRWAWFNGRPWRAACGKKGVYQAKVRLRGFHLHLQHPSEWVSQFLEGDEKGAEDFLRWLTWNQQNLLQLQLLRSPEVDFASLKETLSRAKERNIHVALSTSFVFTQQKSYTLIPFWAQFFPSLATRRLEEKIERLSSLLPFDSLVVELGTTEFTPSPWNLTLSWLETARSALAKKGKGLLTKIHVSTNQVDASRGNFNFLPQHADPGVGVLPHTVHFYGLRDTNVKMYGRRDFKDMESFLVEQARRRETWYYPETSYYVGLDIDVPLLLTDYLLARAEDWRVVESAGVGGHVTFSTGQELGYWLFDWTTALLAEKGVNDPLTGLKLLGESAGAWEKILRFQNLHFKQKRLIAPLSSANLMDELPFLHPIMERNLLRRLRRDPVALHAEIEALSAAEREKPSLEQIRNPELKAMLEVTWLRIRHALALRLYLRSKEDAFLAEARKCSAEAEAKLAIVRGLARWTGTLAYQRRDNPTSYPEGYAYTATRLHFWKREEEIVAGDRWNPFFQNLYDPFRLLF
jgi:hypothetical protein